MIASFLILIIHYFSGTLSPVKRNQIRYLFLGYLFGYTGAVDFLPTFGMPIYPIGFISYFIFLSVIAYAVIKYRLLDITIAVTRAGIFVVVYLFLLGIPYCNRI